MCHFSVTPFFYLIILFISIRFYLYTLYTVIYFLTYFFLLLFLFSFLFFSQGSDRSGIQQLRGNSQVHHMSFIPSPFLSVLSSSSFDSLSLSLSLSLCMYFFPFPLFSLSSSLFICLSRSYFACTYLIFSTYIVHFLFLFCLFCLYLIRSLSTIPMFSQMIDFTVYSTNYHQNILSSVILLSIFLYHFFLNS